MSATTSPYGSSSGRASVPPGGGRGVSRPSGRTGVPQNDYEDSDDYRGGSGGRPPGGGTGYPPPGKPYRGRRRPRWGRIALLAGVAVVVIGLIAGISLYSYASNLDKGLKRTDAFSNITTGRPTKTVTGALNILLVGSDSRDPDNKDDKANAWR